MPLHPFPGPFTPKAVPKRHRDKLEIFVSICLRLLHGTLWPGPLRSPNQAPSPFPGHAGGSPGRPLTIGSLAAGLTKFGVWGWGDAAPVG